MLDSITMHNPLPSSTKGGFELNTQNIPLEIRPERLGLQSVGCPAYPPTKWYGDTYKMVAPMGVAAYKMVAPGYPTCPPTSSILG